MSDNKLIYSWDIAKTGRTKHVFKLPSNKPMCGKAVERADRRRNVRKYLCCVQCTVIAQELNKNL